MLWWSFVGCDLFLLFALFEMQAISLTRQGVHHMHVITKCGYNFKAEPSTPSLQRQLMLLF